MIGLNAGQVAEHVGDDVAVGELLAVGGEPADDMAAFALAGEDFPQGFAAACGGGDGYDAAGGGVYLGEAGHAVVVGHFAGGDAGPQHGGELWFQCGEVTGGAGIDQVGGSRGGAAVHERVEEFPIGGVPADEEEAFGLGHATGVTGSVALVVLADGDWRCLR